MVMVWRGAQDGAATDARQGNIDQTLTAAIQDVLWVDLRTSSSPSVLHQTDVSGCCIHHWRGWEQIDEAVHNTGPQVAVFEYDYPNALGLKALQLTKAKFPWLPIFMLTEQHCESLAIWAFRTGVRDFFVKPLECDELGLRFKALQARSSPTRATRLNLLPRQPIPIVARCTSHASVKSTFAVARYIERHLHEQITLRQASRLSEMSTNKFSRAFKLEQGLSFKQFLIEKRIASAKDMLRNPRAAIADIAHATGFGDPDYFSRVFRSRTGMTPSRYREETLVHEHASA
ncbi:MAG: helix-turn-helix domain-containing protein [Gammaproteobacteria bacterium]|nr:helix-turn-helix domain-containing protein [Gammaproteobacteria bacterium]